MTFCRHISICADVPSHAMLRSLVSNGYHRAHCIVRTWHQLADCAPLRRLHIALRWYRLRPQARVDEALTHRQQDEGPPHLDDLGSSRKSRAPKIADILPAAAMTCGALASDRRPCTRAAMTISVAPSPNSTAATAPKKTESRAESMRYESHAR